MRAIDWIFAALWLISITGCMLTPRTDFYSLFSLYTIAFACYGFLVFKSPSLTIWVGLIIAFACRISIIFIAPNLSDDFYRFIWDGMVMYAGIHPMAYTPSVLMAHPEIINASQSLYELLNSREYYSVYPPLAQFIYYVSFLINHLNIDGHILFFRLINLLADGLIVYCLWSLLRRLKMDVRKILIYALNPLILIELTGNLHMEGLMIATFLAGILLALRQRAYMTSVFMSVSIALKMMTVVLIPFMWKEIDKRNRLKWILTGVFVTAGLFSFFFNGWTGWLQSIGLWMQSFEFNASFYYLAREADAMLRGYPYIKLIGPLMTGISFLIILLVWIIYLKRKDLPWASAMVIAMTVYFLFSTTIHPWYLSTLIALSVLSQFGWPVIWSYLIFLSYSHYLDGGFSENYLFIITEYALLFAWIYLELRFNRQLKRRQEFSPAVNK